MSAHRPRRPARALDRDRERPRNEGGHATVELALVLPVLALLLLAVIQVGLVVRAQLLVAQAAREAARAAAVDPDPLAARRAAVAATSLDETRLDVDIGERGRAGGLVTVHVRYRAVTDVPLIGPLIGDVDLYAAAAMRIEVAPAHRPVDVEALARAPTSAA